MKLAKAALIALLVIFTGYIFIPLRWLDAATTTVFGLRCSTPTDAAILLLLSLLAMMGAAVVAGGIYVIFKKF